jgi:phenylacetate-CoA ligase
MSEVLDPETCDDCQKYWGGPVIESYSAKEAGTIALQCPEHGRLHVQSESLLLEILYESGRACAPDKIGCVVISDLHNLALPLIRYEIGDYAEAAEPCPCGRGLPTLDPEPGTAAVRRLYLAAFRDQSRIGHRAGTPVSAGSGERR